MFDFVRIGAGAVIGAAVVFTPAYLIGKSDGRASERAAILTRSVEVLRERNAVDGQIRNMDGAALCRALGGLPDECASIGM